MWIKGTHLEVYKYILDEFAKKIMLLEEAVWEVTAVLILVPRFILGYFLGLGVSGDVPCVHSSQDLRVLGPESGCESLPDVSVATCPAGVTGP